LDFEKLIQFTNQPDLRMSKQHIKNTTNCTHQCYEATFGLEKIKNVKIYKKRAFHKTATTRM